MFRLSLNIGIAALLLAGAAGPAVAVGGKPLYPTGTDCAALPATQRQDCARTQIAPPESEPPAPVPGQEPPRSVVPEKPALLPGQQPLPGTIPPQRN